MTTGAQYTQPIYQAVVSSLALENLQREEAEREQERFLAKAFECLTRGNDVIRVFAETDFTAEPSNESVVPVHVALCVLVTVSRQAVASTRRDYLPHVCAKYQAALASVLDDLDAIADRLEEIAEAWGLASDEALRAEIKQALSAHVKKDSEIPAWRKVLAEISD